MVKIMVNISRAFLFQCLGILLFYTTCSNVFMFQRNQRSTPYFKYISLLIVSLLWCIKMIRHRSRTHDDLYTRNLTVINITNFRFLINNDICDVDNIVIVTTVFSGNRSDILNVQKKSDRYSTLQKKLHRCDFFYISTYTFMSNLVRDQEFRGKRRDQVKIISQKYFWLNTVCQEVLG